LDENNSINFMVFSLCSACAAYTDSVKYEKTTQEVQHEIN